MNVPLKQFLSYTSLNKSQHFLQGAKTIYPTTKHCSTIFIYNLHSPQGHKTYLCPVSFCKSVYTEPYHAYKIHKKLSDAGLYPKTFSKQSMVALESKFISFKDPFFTASIVFSPDTFSNNFYLWFNHIVCFSYKLSHLNVHCH